MRNIEFFSKLIHSYEIQISLVYGVITKLFNKKFLNGSLQIKNIKT